jgi:hypothetical protein
MAQHLPPPREYYPRTMGGGRSWRTGGSYPARFREEAQYEQRVGERHEHGSPERDSRSKGCKCPSQCWSNDEAQSNRRADESHTSGSSLGRCHVGDDCLRRADIRGPQATDETCY